MKKKDRDIAKLLFVKANRELFTKAYLEYINKVHKRTKYSPSNNFSKFIAKAREDFNYSPSSNAIDIWVCFVLAAPGITKDICNQRNEERLKLASIRRALGYIDDKLRT